VRPRRHRRCSYERTASLRSFRDIQSLLSGRDSDPPALKFSNRGRQGVISRYSRSRRGQSSLRGRPYGPPHVGVGSWIGPSGHAMIPRHGEICISGVGLISAMRPGGDAPLKAKSTSHVADHTTSVLQRNGVLVFPMAWRMTGSCDSDAGLPETNFLGQPEPPSLQRREGGVSGQKRRRSLHRDAIASFCCRAWRCVGFD
jgi:hypothetical protein